MKLTIDIDKFALVSADRFMEEIADATKWTFEPWPSNGDGMETVYVVTTADGRRGRYDVVADEFEYEDGNEGTHFLFGCPTDDMYLAPDIRDFLHCNCCIAKWGKGDDGEWYLLIR